MTRSRYAMPACMPRLNTASLSWWRLPATCCSKAEGEWQGTSQMAQWWAGGEEEGPLGLERKQPAVTKESDRPAEPRGPDAMEEEREEERGEGRRVDSAAPSCFISSPPAVSVSSTSCLTCPLWSPCLHGDAER